VWFKSKTAVSILSRLVLAATSYYIWLERNGILFKKNILTPDQIVDVIISMVRLKLVTFKFKKMSTGSYLLLDQWKIPSYCIFHDGSTRNPNEPPRYLYNKDLFFLKNGNTEEKKYVLALHKIHAKLFLEADLEEMINCWVQKEFKNFNEDARLSIQHWKDSWHKRVYK
ncbi:hypothetical protein Tco_1373036, partial [Tanacetum coccineum]